MADTLSLKDQLLNDEGLKFTVTANLSPDIYAKLFATISLSVIVAIFAGQMIKKIFKT